MKLCYWGVATVLAWLCLALVCDTKPLNHLNWLKISSHRMKRQVPHTTTASTQQASTSYNSYPPTESTQQASTGYTPYPPTASTQQASTTYNPWLSWTTGASTVTPWYHRTTSPYTSYPTTNGPAFSNSSASPNLGCSQNLTGVTGRFSSPGAGSSYTSNLDCIYTIPSPPARSRIVITFQLFQLEDHPACGFDFVSFSDTSQKICGLKTTPLTYSFVSQGRDFNIRFHSDGSVEYSGFIATFTIQETLAYGDNCYHLLTAEEGQIQVPDNDNATYSPNLDCLFTIRPPAGGPWIVNVTLEEFDVQRYYSSSSNYFSTSCNYDYIQILLEGYSSPRMCGTRTSPISYKYNIIERDVNITFHSDSSTQRSGFNITYVYSNNTCVTNLNQTSGTIRSPMAEGGLTYPADTLCIYYLDLGDSLKTVTFTVRVFDVYCGDYFIVHGQRFCGSSLQTSFSLTGRVNITFVTDSSRAGRGVDVDYQVTDYTCDKVLRATSGNIDSYSLSRVALTQDMDCEYIVRPPYYPFITTMFFSPFYMPYNPMNSSDTCSGSYVEINNTQYCGTVYGQYNFTSEESGLLVTYHHAATGQGTREVYHIYYNTRPVSCNVTLTDTAGNINSYSGYGYTSMYSRSYNDNTHCIFTIKGDSAVGQSIVFSLNQFHLEDPDNSTSVCKDYVDLNGEERLCGYQYGIRTFNFDGTFVVTFISDDNQTSMGFNIRYNIVPDGCILSFNSSEGTIVSPVTSSGVYQNNLDCRYTLSSPYTMAKITVTVNRFDLEPPSYSSANCYNDYVYYSDASYTSGRYCGSVAAGTTFTWYTTTGQIDLVFHTNNDINRRGFNVSYTIEEGNFILNMVFSDPHGTIRSPVYDTGLYRNNLNCTYTIRPPTQGHFRFTLKYTQFDVQWKYYNSSSYSMSPSCTYDYVETSFSGLASNRRLCGRLSSPKTYFYNTFGGDFVIHFVTDRSIVRRGFVLEYSFEENSCYRVLTAAEGQIQVPGNDNATYSPNVDCLFTIRPPAGGPWIVNVTLEEFDVQRYNSSSSNYFSTSCSYDYIQILHDGYSSSRMCGTRTYPISYKYNILKGDVNITFHSDSSTQRSGFNITYTYKNNTCVKDLDPNSGTIRSPMAEGGLTYPADTLCIYYLDLGDSLKTVTFTVRVFDVYCGDYFIVLGQRLCGSRMTQTSFSSTGRVNITFVTDSSGAGRGVDVDYHVTDYTCDKVYRATSGNIDSYSLSRVALTQDMDCEYIVRPPYYPFVTTMFFSPFYMPYNPMNSSDTCSGSYVEINNTQYCGTVYGRYNFTSVEPELLVTYHHSATGQGTREFYHIYYNTRPVSCNVTLTDTVGNINSYSGYGSVPVYSRYYNGNTHCIFTIKEENAVGQSIVFSLNQFHLEDPDNSTSVCKDYVDLNGEERLCGYQDGLRTFSFDGTFVVTFISDNNQTSMGFNIRYNIVPDGCILSFNSSEGTIVSPVTSSGVYQNNLDCRYTLSSPYTMAKITVTVNRFDLEPSSYSSANCYNDYVYYSDVSYTSGRYCGSVAAGTTFTWYTTAGQADLVFHTNNEISRTGFNISYVIEEDSCDQVFSDTSGTIRSPVYNAGLYRSNLNCTYIIRPPAQGRYRFTLRYSQFDVQRTYYNSSYYSLSTSCRYDYVETKFSGLTGGGRLCGRMSSPRTYFYNTLGGDFAIHFVTDRSIVRRGFVLEYSFEENSCYRVLTAAEGQIQVPGNDNATYSPNLDCLFTIRPPAGGAWIVNVTLEEFDVQRYNSYYSNYFSTSCSYDYIQILHDGYSSSRMCGTRTYPISYKYNILKGDVNITFHSDSSTQRSGFNITYTYKNNTCVKDLDPNSGTIRSPMSEGGLTYPADTFCIYYLDLGDSLKTVTFTVRVFDVYCGDYFVVLGQRLCGSRMTQTSFSSTGRVNITFVTDSSGAGRGVDVDYHVTDYTCDKVYRATSGNIDSYSLSRVALTQDMDCEYIVRPPYYPFVTTMFFSPFYMPYNPMNSSDTCSGSYVEINNTQYCGTVYGRYNFTSMEPELLVTYHHSATGQGTSEVYHIYYNTRPVSCNVTLTDTAGNINSYSGYGPASVYSGSYNGNTHCIFTIKGENAVGQSIVFSLSRFHLEDPDNSTSVCKDYVDLNGEERLCGYQYGNRTFNFDGTFVVTVISDNNQTSMGFNIRYNIVPDGCIASLSSTEGTVVSPVTSSGVYHNNLDCRYTLSSPYTMAKITVTVNRFDLEPSSYSSANCYNDYVYYSDASYTSGRYCGSLAAGTTYTWYMTAGQADLVFHTNNEISRRGFNISYVIEEDRCDQVFSDTSGTIRSPVYNAGLYRSNLNCTYIIRPSAQGPYRVTLRYSQFDVQRTYYNSSSYSLRTSCRYDYVETKFSGLTGGGRLCGRMRSPKTFFYNTFGGDLAIHFVTDRSIIRRGFLLDYTVEENTCIQVLTAAEGQIQVPGNGNATYSPNLDCLFTIRPPAGRTWTVNVTLEEFDVQRYYSYSSNYYSTSCSYDYIQILYDGYSSSRMCGTRTSSISYIHNIVDGDLNITFHSDGSTQRSGFLIKYSYTENICDYEFTDNQGVMESPNDANYYYENNMLCKYTFMGGNDLYHIFYNFFYFEIYYTSGCSSDYLELPNGQRYCGTYMRNTSYAAVGNTSLTFRSDASYSRRGFRLQYKVLPFNCSRDYTEVYGIISDPNLSGVDYSGDVSCTYTFLMPFYPFILTFIPNRFELQDPGSDGICTTEYVSYDGNRFCGQRNESWQATTADNTMEVNYVSTGAVRGNYSVYYHVSPGTCNVTYTSFSGSIRGNMSNESSDSTCYYRIQNNMAASQIHIRLNSQSRNNSGCNYLDFDGLERRCVSSGSHTTEMTYAYDGDFMVTLSNTVGVEPPLFSLYYNIVPANCVQRFTTETGSFASPADADGNYMNDLRCSYTISGGSSPYILNLNFITLDLQSSSYCNSDYVQFRYRGSSGYTTTTSRYCTGPRSLRYTVSSGDFNVSFVTNAREVRSGFNVLYAKMPVSCNRTYTADEGIIESTPGNGSYYPNNAYCTYTVQGNSTQQTLQFTVQTFSLEYHSSCYYDSLQFGSTSRRKYCGSTLATGRVLTYTFTNTFTLYFKTDSSVTRRGFLINYRRMPYVATTTTTTTTTTTSPSPIPNCNATFTATRGQLRSPNSPRNYPNNIYCRYTFVGSGQTQSISLDFTSFAVERHSTCRYDSVIVNGGNKRCGFTEFTRTYTFTGNFTVQFRTDGSVTYSGFVADYVVSDAPNATAPAPSSTATCTATLSSPSGTIMSPPGGGSNYLDNTRCYYTFTATSYPKTITFTFTTFQLERHSTCRYDYLQFNSGIKKCGTISSLVHTDTMNSQYRVTFSTDGSITRRGFVANYQISDVITAASTITPSTVLSNNGVCGTTLTSSTGRIYYPNTASYGNNVRCQVTIRPGAGQTFNVTFTNFDIENHSQCNYDSLMFRVNGIDSLKYCGRNRAGLTLSFTYTSGDIVVIFRSDGSVIGRGFDFNFQVA